MSDDIHLPELPEPDEQSMANYGIKNDCFSWDAMEDYARAAVLADRERRAQPAPGAEALLSAAKIALDEMRHTIAPRDSFTDAVDALDAAIAAQRGEVE